MMTTSRPSGRLTAMICRIRLRLAPAVGQSLGVDGALVRQPWPVEQPDEQRNHHPADRLHQMDVQAGAGKPAKGLEHHPVTAGEQQQDRHPNPGKELPECDPHQPQALRRLQRAERRAQADIDCEHAADPDDGTEYVQAGRDSGHERAPGSRSESGSWSGAPISLISCQFVACGADVARAVAAHQGAYP